MISFSSTEEYIYAQAEKINGEKTENEYVTVRTDNGEEALLKQINTPEITGVAVVCGGGRSDRVREEIYRTVTAVLGIPAGRIYVAAME
jgi:stage III sporulation protein AG